jgi:hypothetical protein
MGKSFSAPRGISQAATLLLEFLATGCCTVTGGMGAQGVKVHSTPPGAQVSVDGQPRGATPVTLYLQRNQPHDIQVEAPGYEPVHASVRPNVNPWLFGNILVGGLFGVVVDGVTQSWYRLYPGSLELRLRPGSGPPPAAAEGTSTLTGLPPLPPSAAGAIHPGRSPDRSGPTAGRS